MNTKSIFAQFGKEKRYNLFPQLLSIHVPRMLESFRVIDTYMKDSELLKSGMIKLENFLGSWVAEQIAEEIQDSPVKDGRKPGTMLKNRTGQSLRAKPQIYEEVYNLYPERVHKRVLGQLEEHTYLQHLLNRPDDEDEQKVFHTDTFFPCTKFWYFPKAVGVEDGPFWYVPYSTVLNQKLIDWHKARVEDLKNGRDEDWRGVGHREGSFRISPDEITSLGLKADPVCVEADTLVIANVFGFHRRGDVKEPKHRVSIHGSIRLVPFA